MTEGEKEDYRQQTREEEEEYLERRARVDYVTKPRALKRMGAIAKATHKRRSSRRRIPKLSASISLSEDTASGETRVGSTMKIQKHRGVHQ